jgi:hypothetical protein
MCSLKNSAIEIAESALLSAFEPNPIHFNARNENDVPRVRAALRRASDGRIARFRVPVNRNGFLLGCLDYTEFCSEEHLIVGYGFRHGLTTKIQSVHHVTGSAHSVMIPPVVAHALLDHYRRHETNEIILFHNHPRNLLNLLLDYPPLPSQTDRLTLESRALQPAQILCRFLNQGRVMFFLQQNGFVREFTLPSVLAIIERIKAKKTHAILSKFQQ